MNVQYYKAIRDDETVALAGDIIAVDWDNWSDGYTAHNLTRQHIYNPFRTSDQHGELMEKISERDAHVALYLKARE